MAEVEIPLADVLAKMENIGFGVDKKGIEDYGAMLTEQLKSLETSIYESAGSTFNINSPKQLGEILFVKLQIPTKKKSDRIRKSTRRVVEEE